jgi:hypothetical protein
MSLNRFLAYVVLGCWIAVTAVVVGTALQWFAARGASQVKIQRSWDAQKEASSDPDANFQRFPLDTAEDRAAAGEARHNHERLVLRADLASEEMSDAIQTEQFQQRQFLVEFAVWGGLTLLGSALLSERR